MLSSNAFFNKISISHECLDNSVRKRWVLTGAGIQGSRLVTLGRLALLNCILVSHKYFSNPAMKQGVLLEQESKEAGLVSPSNPQRSADHVYCHVEHQRDQGKEHSGART